MLTIEAQAFKIALETAKPLFEQIKADPRSRIQETAVSYEALLPEGPYDLWRSGETARRVKDLVGAFAQFPHLPKMLNRQAILDTLIEGCREGQFVLRVTRPDRSTRTIWRQQPDDAELKNTTMEVVLPESAELSAHRAGAARRVACCPNSGRARRSRWPTCGAYFAGGKVIKIARQGYEEPVTIPKAPSASWMRRSPGRSRRASLAHATGPTSLLAEDIPAGLLTDVATLRPPPAPLAATEVLPAIVPDGWKGDTSTAHAISKALSAKAGQTLPWATVRAAIEGALQGRLIERTEDSGPWPCGFDGARQVKLRIPAAKPDRGIRDPEPDRPKPPPGVLVASAQLKPGEIQELADQIGAISSAAVGHDLKVAVRIEVGAEGKRPPDSLVASINNKLKEISPDLELK